MSSCEDKLSQIRSLCTSSTDTVCTQILAVVNNSTSDTVDNLWGKDGDSTKYWQVAGILVLLVWLCYWLGWFWMAGGMGSELESQKIGEKARRGV